MIGIFVCTYQRPSIRDCLLSLIASVRQAGNPDVELHVVDNDANGSGQSLVNAVSAEMDFPVHYQVESRPGIASARNRCLDIARERVEWLLFVDDDETVKPDWLAGYLSAMEEKSAAAYVGLVETLYPDYVEAAIQGSGLHDRQQRPHLSLVKNGACNNCAFSMAFLQQHHLSFDGRYNQMMGEDSDLFEQIHQLGGSIVWNAQSVVSEILVPERATRAWVFQRYEHVGQTYALRKKRYLSKSGVFKELIQSLLNAGIAWSLAWICRFLPAKHVRFYAYFLRNRAKVRAFLSS